MLEVRSASVSWYVTRFNEKPRRPVYQHLTSILVVIHMHQCNLRA
jgi:hypothetical protein